MKKLNLFVSIIAILVCIPIWFYLLYKILVLVNATELMWFLYWIYMPATMIFGIVSKIAENIKE